MKPRRSPSQTKTRASTPHGTRFSPLPFWLTAQNAAAVLGLKQDKYVCIYENMEKGDAGKQAFGVIGWEQGATGVDLNMDKSGDVGGWTGNITETGAPTPNLFFYKTDYATTKAALESLCSAAA